MDRLEFELKNYMSVIRIDVSSNTGKDIRRRYQGELVPTFIVFDMYGNEVWRQSGKVPELAEILILGL